MKNNVVERYKKEGLVVPGLYDKAFKAIMQDESCRDYLVEIVHELTKLPKEYLEENMVFKNSELPVDYLEEKRKVTDLLVEVEENIINLEMNNFYYKGLIERNDMYLNEIRKLYIQKRYLPIPKFIQINFDNFKKYGDGIIMKFVMMDEETHIKETENYEKYHISLKRIKEKYYNKEKLTRFEKMMLLLVLDKKEELKRVSSEDDIMKKVEEKVLTLSKDAAMILCYDEEEYKEKVRQMVTETEIEEGKEKALKEGMKKGIKEGRKKGRKEGRKEGIREGIIKEKKEIALKLIKENIDINIISSTTGLSIDELKKIKNEK